MITAIGTDPDALEAFYREHVEAVQRFVARRVSDPHLAADLTSDVFLEAVDAAARYKPALGTPRAWPLGIARNVLAMHVRRCVREVKAVSRMQGHRILGPDAIQRIVERIDAERDARELAARTATASRILEAPGRRSASPPGRWPHVCPSRTGRRAESAPTSGGRPVRAESVSR